MLKRYRFLSLLINCFPFVREFRLRKKIRHRRIKTQRKSVKDEPKHLRRYVMMSGTIRRL
ncbi:MAG: hypothetical protein WAL30_03800 [Candidatus Aquirickettsiella sp.]